MAAGELAKRLVVAAVGIPMAVILVYLGGWALGVVLAILAAAGVVELNRLAEQKGTRPFTAAACTLATLLVLVPVVHPTMHDVAAILWSLCFVFALGLSAAAIWWRGVEGGPLRTAAVSLFGPVLIGGGFAFAILLRNLGDIGELASPARGAALIAFPITLAWMGDTFAFFVGRAWGRHKLIPAVSPGKTVEGAIAGFVGTVLVGAIYAGLIFTQWLAMPISPLAGALAGVIVAPAAQVGDLAESLLKREAGVKDSGHFFPGHGGVLDRFDSLFFAIPVGYFYFTVLLPVWVETLPWL
jgi:phosphatidate cytidylyltransferase